MRWRSPICGQPPVRKPVAAPFDGLTYAMVGWPTGFRGAAHHLVGQPMKCVAQDRSSPTHSAGAGDRNRWARTRTGGRGPEVVGGDRNRWAGTGSRGGGPEVVGWDKELPVSAHDDLSQVTRPGPTRGEQAPPEESPAFASSQVRSLTTAFCPSPTARNAHPPRVLQQEPRHRHRERDQHTPGRRSPTHRAGDPHFRAARASPATPAAMRLCGRSEGLGGCLPGSDPVPTTTSGLWISWQEGANPGIPCRQGVSGSKTVGGCS